MIYINVQFILNTLQALYKPPDSTTPFCPPQLLVSLSLLSVSDLIAGKAMS